MKDNSARPRHVRPTLPQYQSDTKSTPTPPEVIVLNTQDLNAQGLKFVHGSKNLQC